LVDGRRNQGQVGVLAPPPATIMTALEKTKQDCERGTHTPQRAERETQGGEAQRRWQHPADDESK
jgi:hypothetical protein